MYELVVETDFAAAHNIREYGGNCERLHGHNWKVRVGLRARRLDRLGMVMDFRDVKARLSEVLKALDHQYLNEIEPFRTSNPTTENIARFICERLMKGLPKGVSVGKVTVWESERCAASYAPERKK
jgi:6-pyruvoyltetrahydropterin/6-carboxytetrahydropterin synthase